MQIQINLSISDLIWPSDHNYGFINAHLVIFGVIFFFLFAIGFDQRWRLGRKVSQLRAHQTQIKIFTLFACHSFSNNKRVALVANVIQKQHAVRRFMNARVEIVVAFFACALARIARIVDDKLRKTLKTQAMIVAFQAHVAIPVQNYIARVAKKVCLELRKIFPEHIARHDVLLVLFVGFDFHRERLH